MGEDHALQERILRARIIALEDRLFEAHIGTCWGSPNCKCDVWCKCPHRQVMAQLPKCCPDCQIVLKRQKRSK